jgi:hypothetical protein
MKKLLIITNVIWVSIFCFIACDPEEEKPNTENCNTIRSNYNGVQTSGRISPIEANIMADEYYKYNYPAVNSRISLYTGIKDKDLDARSVWFSLETLKQFLWEIESKSATCKGCETLNLGVRIYYGVYPEPSDPNDTTFQAKEKKKHSVFMVPTYAKRDANKVLRDYDFNPNQLTAIIEGEKHGSKCQPITLMEYKNLTNPSNPKITKAAFSNNLLATNFLEEKFILVPNPKSLVKTIAVDEIDLENEKGKGKGKKDGDVKKVTFNTLNVVGGNYMFQNHGALCPVHCKEEDYFTQ